MLRNIKPFVERKDTPVGKDNLIELKTQEGFEDALTEVLRGGARRLLAEAVEAEVEEFLSRCQDIKDDDGRRLVTRNGYHREREVQTGIGPVPIKAPRVRDRRCSLDRVHFTSSILPPYLRKTRSLEELIPWLYLKGISTGDFSEALSALLGPEAPGLSPSAVSRLKEGWKAEFSMWRKRSLKGKRYVYFWVDGVYLPVRLDHEKQCLLVIIGATADGRKELVALEDGYRESEQSWMEVLLDLKSRGLDSGPRLAIGDGHLGFWKALPKVYTKARCQRCWVHKAANVLNKLPRGEQSKAKERLHDIWMASTKKNAVKAFDLFVKTYEAKYPKAAECLIKDREDLLAFYDFPAEHWKHIRTTNPIESVFSSVKMRTRKTRGCLSRTTALTMAFRLLLSAQKRWQKLNGSTLLAEVIRGVKFVDGTREERIAA